MGRTDRLGNDFFNIPPFSSRGAFLTKTQRPLAVILLAVICSAMIAALHWKALSTLNLKAEGFYYYDLAQNGPQHVEKPYANRFLHPLIARAISDVTGLDLDKSFYVLGLLSLLMFTIAVTWILNSLTRIPLLVFPLLLSAASIQLISSFYHHDLLYAALLALLFLTLWREKTWILSSLILLALFLTRDSTLLLSACIIGVAWFKAKRKIIIPIVAVSLFGTALTAYVTRLSPPNVHRMGSFVYLALKVPFNFFENVFGVEVWLNTFVKAPPPLFTLELPKWLHLGSISTVGLCPWQPVFPLTTIFMFLTYFGIAPFFLKFGLWKFRRQIAKQASPPMLLLAIYGLISYLISPLLGTHLSRYFGGGWPAFWLAVPAMIMKYYNLPRKAVLRLVALHVLVSWLPFVLYSVNPYSVPIVMSAVVIAAVFQALALKEIRNLGPLNEGLIWDISLGQSRDKDPLPSSH
jgi:hypothetical protein